MIGSSFTAYIIIFQCVVKSPSGKTQFLSYPDIQLVNNHTGLKVRRLTGFKGSHPV